LLTRSGFEYILRKHVRTASQHCPSLTTKRVHPHVLRHSCALTVLQATKDLRKVALWLGHAQTQTTEMYTRVDPSVKLEALESVVPPKLRSGRFKATDKLIASLKAVTVMRSKKPSKRRTGGTYQRQLCVTIHPALLEQEAVIDPAEGTANGTPAIGSGRLGSGLRHFHSSAGSK
jgi:hypothetical protein